MYFKFKIIFMIMTVSSIYAQCSDLDQNACNHPLYGEGCEWIGGSIDCNNITTELNCSANGCDWNEDIETINCSTLPTYGWGPGSCDYYYPDCYEYLDYGGSYGSWSTACGGGIVQIDNSYCDGESGSCEEIEILECSGMNEMQCDIDDSCDWIEDIDSGNCSNLNSNECNSTSDCNWEYNCTQWGSWYTWICYEYGYECTGGYYEQDNSYCEEIEFQLGDINGDYFINILDIIETIDLILESEYDYIVDMDGNSDINILDIIQMISIILNGE